LNLKCDILVSKFAFTNATCTARYAKAREEDERAERVIAANKGRIQGSAGPSGSKSKKKKLSPSQQVSDLGPNRRERRKMARDGTGDTGDEDEE
jgi:hypothetical protein